MLIFGKHSDSFNITDLFEKASEMVSPFANTSIHEIIKVLHDCSILWVKDSSYYKTALAGLQKDISFSKEMIELTLDIIPDLLNENILLERIRSEIHDENILDHFIKKNSFSGSIKAFPRGVLTHITAGNIFLGCIDSLLMGFLTKNINIVKLSSNNQFFPNLFIKSLLEADTQNILSPYFSVITWKGGDKTIETIVKQKSDTIMAWGGEEMISSFRKDLGLTTKFLDFGPKISFQIISNDGLKSQTLKESALQISNELFVWDQNACASPQNLFVEESIDIKNLMKEIAMAMDSIKIPRAKLDANEQVEIIKDQAVGEYEAALESGFEIRGNDYYLRLDSKKMLTPSPLNRTLLIKQYKDFKELKANLAPFSFYLQSVSLLLNTKEEEQIKNMLSLLGVKRFAPLGSLLKGMNGAPHDGRFILNELVHYIPDEKKKTLLSEIKDIIADIKYFKDCSEINSLSDLPFMDDSTYKEYSVHESDILINTKYSDGRYFSSGGTSGNPKFIFYTHEEFNIVAKMLSRGLTAQGIGPSDLCANLFAAGNFWSSFIAIDQALAQIKVKQLPIGGLSKIEDIVSYLQLFKPTFLFGIPSLFLQYAHFCEKNNIKLKVKKIFYAGEHFNKKAMKYLIKIWGVEEFCSAGYASVDAGPIGYQDHSCAYGEHIIFKDYIHMEIIDNEAVITSKFRKAMPIIRYKTGDHVEWTDKEQGKFLLKGRLSNQFNIWSCKVNLSEIQVALTEFESFQVILYNDEKGNDLLEIKIEDDQVTNTENIINLIYKSCQDINKTHELTSIQDFIQITFSKITRVERTGKIKSIIDNR
jgi:phenylacetate-CoA ligase